MTASEIVALVRTSGKAADLAELGVQVREADYSRPQTLGAALADVDRLLLISSSEAGQRVVQHTNVIEAAVTAGVSRIVYTSMLDADESTNPLAQEHRDTEHALLVAGLPFTVLRNGWYTENYTAQLGTVLEHGAVVGSARDGRIASAARRDYAAAAAAVLAGEGHENTAYELSGDVAWSLPEYAAEVARQTGREVVYNDLPLADYRALLTGSGMPTDFAEIFADVDDAIARGRLALTTGDLARLVGRPTTPLAETVAEALKA